MAKEKIKIYAGTTLERLETRIKYVPKKNLFLYNTDPAERLSIFKTKEKVDSAETERRIIYTMV
jgi:hypothetical protein